MVQLWCFSIRDATWRDATSVLYVRRPTYFKYCNVSKAEAIPIMKFRSYQKWVSCVDLLLITGVETIANNLLIIKKAWPNKHCILYLLNIVPATAVAQWLRCCATNRKVAGSMPGCISGFFIDIKFFRSHYGPGVDSASNRNEYQDYFLGVKAVGA